ncbi:MAG: hypothetical protein IJA24_08245 [Alistipes sp.]|nr:hypothetical protein [Alistipes sp.]
MTELKFYKPVGGILSAELFFASDLNSVDDMVKGQGVAVELCDDKSTYEEHFSAESGLVSVQHTLTLVADGNKGREWMQREFIGRCSTEGVVASVEMATGEEIIVGHCPRFLFEQALRLESLKFLSGEKLNDSPQIVLTLTCHDTLSAM